MAFAFVITEQRYSGNKKIVEGTWTNTAGSTGGNISTGLTNCTNMFLQGNGATVDAAEPVTNETFPVAGGVVTIVTTADRSGRFKAEGY